MNWQNMLDNVGRWSIAMTMLGIYAWLTWEGKPVPQQLDILLGAGIMWFFKGGSN